MEGVTTTVGAGAAPCHGAAERCYFMVQSDGVQQNILLKHYFLILHSRAARM